MTAACERCRRTPGWEPVVIDGVSRLRRCGCWARAHAAPASVPHEFREAGWSTWLRTAANRHALEAAQAFLRGGEADRDLLLCGPVGTGKTRLACTALNEAWRSGERSVRFVRVSRLLLRLQPSAAEGAESFDRLAAVRLLALDDLGAERETATDYTRRTLLMLYEARRDAGLRTIWTSNRTPAEVGAFMGDDRLASRIAGWCRVVSLDGPDWRLRGGDLQLAGERTGDDRAAAGRGA
ncbi:MAG: ATP-binding protein [Acidobacteria bacterium]|nr:ATP-binding protein [Acidobacteriota bacterium]